MLGILTIRLCLERMHSRGSARVIFLATLLVVTSTAVKAQIVDTARVSGRVLDSTGGSVASAGVTLMEMNGPGTRSAVTAADGVFVFEAVTPGSYMIAVNSPGFQEFASEKFTLKAAQVFRMPDIELAIAGVTSSILVLPTEVIAEQQIKVQEEQRAFGIIPNFYTSYVWNAAPLNPKQKFKLAWHTAIDPVGLIGVTIGAGVEQATNAFPGFGSGPGGYAKRWAALFANERTNELLNRAVLPSLFHQDPRYFYQGSGSTWSRVGHAVGSVFVARGDSGHAMPNYGSIIGKFSSGAVSNLYYPSESRGARLILANAAIGFVGHVGQNLIREFIYPHAPGGGKPPSD